MHIFAIAQNKITPVLCFSVCISALAEIYLIICAGDFLAIMIDNAKLNRYCWANFVYSWCDARVFYWRISLAVKK